MAGSAAAKSDVDALNTVLDSSVAVIKNLKGFVHNVYTKATENCWEPDAESSKDAQPKLGVAWDPPTPLDALALAHDSATLIRAHATKISLLIINEPFTPTAISKVVQEVVHGPVPALAKAVEVCFGDRYTHCMQREVAMRGEGILSQLLVLLESIPRDGRVLSTEKAKDSESSSACGAAARNNFTDIGILWRECDELKTLAKKGVQGRLIQIMEQLSDTIKDSLEELKEWSDEQAEDDDEEDGDGGGDDDDDDQYHVDLGETPAATSSGGNQYDDAQAALDAFMESESDGSIPRGDPDKLRPRLELALKKMRLTGLLYKAIVKRRLRTLPSDGLPSPTPTDTARRLDTAFAALWSLPDKFDELAMAFYRLDVQEVDRLMDKCFHQAFMASEVLVRSWDGKEDEFSAWVLKFQTEIRTTLRAGE